MREPRCQMAVSAKMSKVLAIIGNILALLAFALGLLSPLTPSEGTPTIGAIATFVAFPLVLLANAWAHYTRPISRYVVVFQAIFIVLITGWLLLLQ